MQREAAVHPKRRCLALVGRSWSHRRSLDLAWGGWSEAEVPPTTPVAREFELLQKKKQDLVFWGREEDAGEMAQEGLLNKQDTEHSWVFILIFSLL